MTSLRKLFVATIFSFLGLVTLAGAYIQPVIVQYRNAAPCGKLAGLPRLLKAVGLINQGNCQLAIGGGTCKNPNATCTFIDPVCGQQVNGHCTNVTGGCACVPTQGQGVPDLSITMTHTGNFFQGRTGALYTIAVTNVGGASTSGTVTVSDTLPEGLTATSIAGTNWSCTQPGGPCSRSDALCPNATYDAIVLTVDVSSNAASSVTNQATVSGGGESNTANDTANDTTAVLPFQIISIGRIDNQLLLQGHGVPNQVNQIEVSPDLSPNSFQTLGSVTPDASGAFSFIDSAPGTNRFYRLAFP